MRDRTSSVDVGHTLAGPDGALLAQQFGSLVAENAMKPQRIHPQEDRYVFGPADARDRCEER